MGFHQVRKVVVPEGPQSGGCLEDLQRAARFAGIQMQLGQLKGRFQLCAQIAGIEALATPGSLVRRDGGAKCGLELPPQLGAV